MERTSRYFIFPRDQYPTIDTFRLIINFSDVPIISFVVLQNKKKNVIFSNKYGIRSRIQHRNSRKLDYKSFKNCMYKKVVQWETGHPTLNTWIYVIHKIYSPIVLKNTRKWELHENWVKTQVFQKMQHFRQKHSEIRIQR